MLRELRKCEEFVGRRRPVPLESPLFKYELAEFWVMNHDPTGEEDPILVVLVEVSGGLRSAFERPLMHSTLFDRQSSRGRQRQIPFAARLRERARVRNEHARFHHDSQPEIVEARLLLYLCVGRVEPARRECGLIHVRDRGQQALPSPLFRLLAR